MKTKLPKQPFNTLAISLSGGGYRATSFHLGLFTYLDHLKWHESTLLERVRVISTVSGGTFTGVSYASTIAGGGTLTDCYRALFRFMSEVDLIEHGLQKLSDFEQWNSPKGRSLINAFSLVYFDKLDNKDFSHLFDHSIHLKEIIFNSTEFSYGLPFRFQHCLLKASRNKHAFFGNRQVSMPLEAMREVRLADVIAASSCFPLGFEPINFPADFGHENSSVLNELVESHHPDMWGDRCQFPIGLMDGGIVDNQGIDSVINAEKRMRAYKNEHKALVSDDVKTIDLFIISDVASPFMDKFIKTDERENRGWRKLSFRCFSWIGGIALALSFGSMFLAHYSESGIVTFITGFLTALFFLIAVVGFYISRVFHKLLRAFDVDEFFVRRVDRFTKIKFGIYETLIRNRFKSVKSMVSEVFMKQIRRYGYDSVYSDPGWYSRLIMNGIYELTPKQTEYRNKGEGSKLCKELKNVSPGLMAVAESAKCMETTLWFTPEELNPRNGNKLKSLIACGQFTACFNLMEYIEKHMLNPDRKAEFETYPLKLQGEIKDLYDKMLDEWRAFNRDPYWMINNYHKENGID